MLRRSEGNRFLCDRRRNDIAANDVSSAFFAGRRQLAAEGEALGCRSAARSRSLGDYFFNSSPSVRAMRLTDPAWRPSSAAILDVPTPCRASVINRRTSCSAHCFGFGVFMMRSSIRTS